MKIINPLDEIFDQQEAKYLKQIETERKQKEEALQKTTNMVKILFNKGIPVSEIAQAVGKTEDEVKKMLG